MPSSIVDCFQPALSGSTVLRTIANIVEHVGFVYPASPQANHILVSVAEKCEPVSVSRFCNCGEEVVCRDPVRTLYKEMSIIFLSYEMLLTSHKHPYPIDFKQKSRSSAILISLGQLLLDKLGGAETNVFGHVINDLIVLKLIRQFVSHPFAGQNQPELQEPPQWCTSSARRTQPATIAPRHLLVDHSK